MIQIAAPRAFRLHCAGMQKQSKRTESQNAALPKALEQDYRKPLERHVSKVNRQFWLDSRKRQSAERLAPSCAL